MGRRRGTYGGSPVEQPKSQEETKQCGTWQPRAGAFQ